MGKAAGSRGQRFPGSRAASGRRRRRAEQRGGQSPGGAEQRDSPWKGRREQGAGEEKAGDGLRSDQAPCGQSTGPSPAPGSSEGSVSPAGSGTGPGVSVLPTASFGQVASRLRAEAASACGPWGRQRGSSKATARSALQRAESLCWLQDTRAERGGGGISRAAPNTGLWEPVGNQPSLAWRALPAPGGTCSHSSLRGLQPPPSPGFPGFPGSAAPTTWAEFGAIQSRTFFHPVSLSVQCG